MKRRENTEDRWKANQSPENLSKELNLFDFEYFVSQKSCMYASFFRVKTMNRRSLEYDRKRVENIESKSRESLEGSESLRYFEYFIL